MKLGYIGLGKMGLQMVARLVEKGHEPVVWNRSKEPVREAEKCGADSRETISELIAALPVPRLIWVMVSHGAVSSIIDELSPLLSSGDTIIDGGNSLFRETVKRGETLRGKAINFIDAGVSGGPSGARSGACIMVGGEEVSVKKYEPLFRDLAAPNAFLRVGKTGAGHFAKMVHNGIEYGMMQALAEGFAVLRASPFKPSLAKLAALYNHKSVIKSRLVGWLESGFQMYGDDLDAVSGTVAQNGEGKWTVEVAEELQIPVPIIKGSVEYRKITETAPSFTGKVLSTLRNQFGGHSIM